MTHRLLSIRPSRTIAVLAVVVVAAFGGVAWAGIPGSDGVIHSCYNASSNPSGQLRVIDTAAGATCAKNEKALTFNQTGPKGDKGEPGIQGIPGPQGTQGIQGPAGADGVDGTNGTSDVHQASNRGISDGGGPLSVSVPAGSYLVVAYARLGVSDTDAQDAICSIQGAVVTTARFVGEETVPIMGTVVLESPGTISIDCGGFAVFPISMRMFVTRVTSIING